MRRHPWDVHDPDRLSDALERLTIHTDSGFDVCWQFHGMLPKDYEEFRYRRLAFMARYGRQSMLQWGDVEVVEIHRMMRALSSLMKDESLIERADNDS